MSYEYFKNDLHQLGESLKVSNFREIKQSLLQLQSTISSATLISAHRAHLRDMVSELFERIKSIQADYQQQFETEAAENYELLRSEVVEAISYTEKNLNQPDLVWQKLIKVQVLFKGKKMLPEQRDQLYGALQKLFELVKKKREETVRVVAKPVTNPLAELDKKVNALVAQCANDDIDKTWAAMLQLKDTILATELVFNHRKRIIDLLQEGFEVLKERRKERSSLMEEQSARNALIIEEKLTRGALILDSDAEFKEKWEFLLDIQSDFKNNKLLRPDREKLYDILQESFRKLKSEQFDDHHEFERQANENIEYLTPLVDKCHDLAANSTELKKAKAFLIKIQADFKGRKMRTMEREKLYARLQDAFDVLNKRIEKHQADRQDEKQINQSSQHNNIQSQIDTADVEHGE